MKETKFITKFLTSYLVANILIYVIQSIIYKQTSVFSYFANMSCELFYTGVVYSAIVAAFWHLLENLWKNETLAHSIRNVFLAAFFPSISLSLSYSRIGLNIFPFESDYITFYLILILETLLCVILSRQIDKIMYSKKALDFFINIIEKIFWTIAYWSILTIILSWIPFEHVILKSITMPIYAISAPVALFVPNGWAIALNLFIIYILKEFLISTLMYNLQDMQSDEAQNTTQKES